MGVDSGPLSPIHAYSPAASPAKGASCITAPVVPPRHFKCLPQLFPPCASGHIFWTVWPCEHQLRGSLSCARTKWERPARHWKSLSGRARRLKHARASCSLLGNSCPSRSPGPICGASHVACSDAYRVLNSHLKGVAPLKAFPTQSGHQRSAVPFFIPK